jgi:hypothetical protein
MITLNGQTRVDIERFLHFAGVFFMYFKNYPQLISLLIILLIDLLRQKDYF